MERVRNITTFSSVDPKGRDHLEDSAGSWRIILNDSE
jgi:hypothetical protein